MTGPLTWYVAEDQKFNQMPWSFCICAKDGRRLLTIHDDGTVEGNLDDTQEAARAFVDYVRVYWAKPKETGPVRAPGNCAYAADFRDEREGDDWLPALNRARVWLGENGGTIYIPSKNDLATS